MYPTNAWGRHHCLDPATSTFLVRLTIPLFLGPYTNHRQTTIYLLEIETGTLVD